MNVTRLDRQPQIEILVDDFDAPAFNTGEFLIRPTNANIIYGPGGDFRYIQVWGWRVNGADEYAGRRCAEASAQSLAAAPPFLRDLVAKLQP